jgi:hypothetical protein
LYSLLCAAIHFYFLGIYSGSYTCLLNFVDHSYNHVFESLSGLSSSSLSLVSFVVDLWWCHVILLFSYFLCVCTEICSFEAKLLDGNFNHL